MSQNEWDLAVIGVIAAMSAALLWAIDGKLKRIIELLEFDISKKHPPSH